MSDGQGIVDYIEVHNQPQDTGPLCDFDGDGLCNVADIDQLVGGIIDGGNDPGLDINRDGVVDTGDLDDWRSEAATENGLAGPHLKGDSDLSSKVDAADLNNLGINWTNAPNTWSGGDFTANGIVDAAWLTLRT